MPREEALVLATRGAVARALAMDSVTNAPAMAEYLKTVTEVQSPEECQSIVDAGKICKLAHKELDDQVRTITGPLKEAADAAKSLAAPRLSLLKDGTERAKLLYAGWQHKVRMEEQRRQAEAARIEREAAAARERDAEELRSMGAQDVDDVPPEASVYVPPAPALVRRGVGAMHQTVLKKYRVTNLIAALQANPELFDVKLRHNDTKAAMEAGRRSDPDFRLDGIEEYEETSTSLT